MNKGELVDRLAARLGDKKVATRAVDDLLDIINRAIAKGEKVSITGFGTFEKVARPARTARNPRTGETVKLRKTSVPKFRPGAQLKGVANGSVKLGREPKPEPLLPEGVTSTRARKALAEATGAPAAPAKTAAKKTPAKKTTAAKAPARKAAAARTTAGSTTAKATAKKPAAQKSTARKSAGRTTTKKTATKKA